MNTDQITDEILSAFDEMAEEGAEEGKIQEGVVAVETDEPGDQPEAPEGDEPDEPEEVEVTAESDEQPEVPAPESEEEEDEPEGEDGDLAPEVQAYLDRHGGDLNKALKSMVEAQTMLSRRNTEYGEQTRRIAQLEAELAQSQTFASQGGVALSPEQTEWVQTAVESEQPIAFVQQAVQAGEYDLARAVCDAWGSEGDAYAALRTRGQVDQAEQYAYQAQVAAEPPAVIPREELIGMITQQVPDFPEYEADMVEIVNQLGRNHPMVLAANSPDPAEAAAGLVDLYRVAQTRKARVAEVKTTVEAEQKEKKVAEKRRGRVSSAASRSSTTEPPRARQIMPGLTVEELDAALAAE